MQCLSAWRVWIRQLTMFIYSLILVVTIVLIAMDLDKHKADTHVWGWFVGGLFVLFSLPISLWGILQHVINYTKPFLQRREIRIMWMVPIYATDAWLALRFPSAAIYLDTMRECYEAYVIYNFMLYLLSYLNDEIPFLERHLMNQPATKLEFPLCRLAPWNGKKLLYRCKHGVLQYVLVKPVVTALSLICELCGVYHEGDFRADGAWTYLVIIDSVSQSWALYCLFLFYKRMKEDLKAMKPLKKFLCIKFVIFLSFWQSIIIAILVASGLITEQADWVLYDTTKVAAGIQDFAICIEMFFAAIAHYFAFPHHPYINMNESNQRASFWQSLRHVFGLDDVTEDMKDHVRSLGKVASRSLTSLRGPNYGAGSETVPLMTYSKDEFGESMAISCEYHPKQVNGDSDSMTNYAEFSIDSKNATKVVNESKDNSSTTTSKNLPEATMTPGSESETDRNLLP